MACTDELLSIVLITKNEEERIATCLESIFNVCQEEIPFEVILVDSNSKDRTIDIASKYPIDIYKIQDDSMVSPAAGRYVGSHFAQGDYLLFIDGDMELQGGWIGEAIDILRRCPVVGGISGYHNDLSKEDNKQIPDEVRSVSVLAAGGLFDAKAYHEVGGFDPNIRGAEDFELCYRLKRSGYILLQLPVIIADHPLYLGGGPLGMILDPFRRTLAGYHFGIGQVFRKHATDPIILAKHARLHPLPIIQLIWLLGSIVTLVTGLFGVWVLATVIALFSVLLHNKEHRLGTLWSIIHNIPITGSIIVGLLGLPSSDNEFSMQSINCVMQSPNQPHWEST